LSSTPQPVQMWSAGPPPEQAAQVFAPGPGGATRRQWRPHVVSATGSSWGFLPGALFDNGLYCRPDDRGDVVVQVAPPLICGQEEFDLMEQILRHTLTEAQKLI
jgi:hypothetical protein